MKKYTGYLRRGRAQDTGQGTDQWSRDADSAQTYRPPDNLSNAIIQKVRLSQGMWKLDICNPPLPIHNQIPKSLQSPAEISNFYFFQKSGLEKDGELNTDK